MTRWSARPVAWTQGSSGRRGKLVGQGQGRHAEPSPQRQVVERSATTAGDYVWSWLRTISPELGADYAYQFYGIAVRRGVQHLQVELWCSPGARSASRPSAHKLRITLTSPQPWFVQQPSHTSFVPHKATVQRHGKNRDGAGQHRHQRPVQARPVAARRTADAQKNTKFRNAKSVKLDEDRNADHRRRRDRDERLPGGNVDVSTTGIPPADILKWKKTKFFKVWTAIGTYYYGFNVKNISDVNQRRAMAFATDRYQITKYITQSGRIPPRLHAGLDLGWPDDPKNATMPARRNAAGQGVHGEVRNPKKAVKLFTNNSPGHIKIATAVQAM